MIKTINDNVDVFPQEMEAWEACILQAGGDASQCENIAMNILPIYRLWVGELFMSLTGIETFIVEASQKSLLPRVRPDYRGFWAGWLELLRSGYSSFGQCLAGRARSKAEDRRSLGVHRLSTISGGLHRKNVPIPGLRYIDSNEDLIELPDTPTTYTTKLSSPISESIVEIK